jgi:hypothetical protein
MIKINTKELKGVWVVNKDCRHLYCFRPGVYHHRGALGAAGSRNTGDKTACCLTNAYHGCPQRKDVKPDA